MKLLYTRLLSGLLLCLSISLSAQNLTVSIEDANGAQGQQICLNMTGRNFSGISGMQFSVNYNPAVLEFVSANGTVSGTPVNLVGNNPGEIRGSWNLFGAVGYTDAGPFTIATLCFRVLQATETSVVFSDSPVPVEFTTDQFEVVPNSQVALNDGTVNSGAGGGGPTCTDGIQNGDETGVDCGGSCSPCVPDPTCTDGIQNGDETGIDCGGSCAPCSTGGGSDCGAGSSAFNLCLEEVCGIAVNAQTCLTLSVSNFTDVNSLQVTINYPPANLDYVSTTGDPALGDPVTANEPNDGEVRLVFFQPAQTGVTVMDGADFAEVCFTNRSNSRSDLTLSNLRVNRASGQVANPVANNGSINACNTGGNDECGAGSNDLNLCLSELCDVAAGGQACIDITASNFVNVNGFQGVFSFTTGNLFYQSITSNSKLVDPVQANVTSASTVNLVYFQQSQTGVTLDDGEVVATLCFTNQTTDATNLAINNLRLNSPGGEITGAIANPGSVNDCAGPGDCGEGTTDVSICVGSVCGDAGNEVCVPVTIANFDNLGGFQFRFTYTGSHLDYTRIIPDPALASGMTPGNPSDGEFGIVWSDPTSQGVDFPDDRPALEICFTAQNANPTPLPFINNSVRAFNPTGQQVPSQGQPGAINVNCNSGPTCTDGIQNGDETGVDCGGSCSPCQSGEVCGEGSNQFHLCAGKVCDVAVGAQACIDLTVANFSGVNALQVDITYPGANLDYVSTTANTALVDGIADNEVSDGMVSLVYFQQTQAGINLEDGAAFATLCFTNESGNASTIDLSDLRVNTASGPVNDPVTNSGSINDCGGTPTCNDGIQNGNETGVDCGGSCMPCSVDTSFVNTALVVTSANASTGQEVCLQVKTYNFSDAAGLQFAMEFETDKLEFISATGTGTLPGLQANSRDPGVIRVVWFDQNIQSNSLDDGTSILNVCFRVLQACEAEVEITSIPGLTVRVTNPENEAITPVDLQSGFVNPSIPCGGGGPNNVVLDLGRASGSVGQEVCVPLTVTEFISITSLGFSIDFDDTAISFTRATGFGAASLGNPSAGKLSFDYSNGGGQSLNNGSELVELCFMIDRLVAAPLTFSNSPTMIAARNSDGQTVGVVPSNGAINPDVPVIDGLTFQIGSTAAEVGDNICLPVIGYEVVDLIAFQYTINYDPQLLRYTGTGSNFGLRGLSSGSINNSAAGVLRVFWTDPQATGNSLPSGTELYSICFEVLSTDLAVVSFGDTPTDIEFETETGIVEADLLNGQVNGTTAPTIVRADVEGPACSDGSDGSITLTVSGGTSLSYQWQPNVSSSSVAANLEPGTYAVTITNTETGQSSSDQFTVTAPPAFSIEVESITDAGCNGGQNGGIDIRTVGGTAPFLFDWSGDLPDNQSSQTGLDDGMYSLTVTDANGCDRVLSDIEVMEDSDFIVTGVVTNPMPGSPGEIEVTVEGGTPGYTFAWTGPDDFTAATEDISDIVVTGTYCLLVRDAAGCENRQCFNLRSQLALASIDVASGCPGQDNGRIDITVTGGTGTYTYNWSFNGQQVSTEQDLEGLSPGDYSLTLSSGGESLNLVIEVTTPEAIQLPAIVEAAPNGNDGSISVVPTGGNPPFNFSWSGGETTEELDNLTPGEYCVTVTDQLNCSGSRCYTIAAASLAVSTVNTSPASCGTLADGEVSIVLVNGIGPFTASISDLGLDTTSEEREFVLNAPPGTHQILVVDGNGERTELEATVGGPTAITAAVSLTSDTEDMDCSGMISLEIGGGNPGYTIDWSNGDEAATISRLCSGEYTATITDDNGCSIVTDTLRIGRIDEQLVNITPTACQDGTEGSVDVTISGGVEPYGFSWTAAGSTEELSATEDLQGVGPGEYTLSVQDATGATLVRNYNVEIAADFSITAEVTSDFGGFNASCADADDGQIVVSVSGQSTYTYMFLRGEELVGIDSVLNNATPGTYTVSVLDAGGCELTETLEVTGPPAIEISAEVENLSCNSENDGRIIASAVGGQGGFSYAWSNGANAPRIQALSAGDYELTVTDRSGCTANASFSIMEPEDLVVTTEVIDATQGCNGSIRILPLGGSGNYNFDWVPSLPNQGNDPLAEGLCPGDYSVQVTDDNGCQTINLTETVVDRRFPCLNAREVITPDGNGLNESFVIFCSGDEEANNNRLEIYNRWGQLVFEMDDYSCSLDGDANCFEGRTNDGEVLPAGPYYYVFNYQNAAGEQKQQRGSLTIVLE